MRGLANRFAITGGKSLPYDEELEYLISCYTGAINTEITSTRSVCTYISFEMTNVPKPTSGGGDPNLINGKSGSWDFYSYTIYYREEANQTDKYNLSFHGMSTSIIEPAANTPYEFRVTANGSSSATLSVYTNGTLTTSKTVDIRNIDGTKKFYLLSMENQQYPVGFKLKKVQFSTPSGTLLFDGIPVLLNGVAYIFDRVNPTGGSLGNGLYGNVSTSHSFGYKRYGHDPVSPT